MMVKTSMRKGKVSGLSPVPINDRRPLYIAPGGETWVELDGPSLRITQIDKAVRLYPLRRLSRIFVQRRVEWSLEALLACAEFSISVVFFSDDGEVLARLLGKPGARDEMYLRLNDFFLLPQAAGMYRHWREDLRGKAAHWAWVKLQAPRSARGCVACRAWINQRAIHFTDESVAGVSHQWLRALAYDWMESHLQDLGFGRQNELARAGEPALARDLTDIFIWYLEPAYLGWLKRRWLAARRKQQCVRAPARRDMVRLFESRATRSASRGREITSLLHRWLIHNA